MIPDFGQKYIYRQLFHLSAQEMADEPIDEFFTNLEIYNAIQERNKIEASQKT